MNNIGGSSDRSGFGLIAHRLLKNESNIAVHLEIDPETRKLAFVLVENWSNNDVINIDIDTQLKFEWNFRE